MESAIYTGTLRHRRFQPARHEFTYPLFMAFLDIDRIPELMKVSPFASHNRFNWASFDDRDHFGDPRLPLREKLKADAAQNDVRLPDGPIFLLTHLRYLGYNFNPVSLFYCYGAEGKLETILAEVNNTFGESRNYWLSNASSEHPSRPHVYRCPKSMHVSPFMPMELDYRFVLPAPGEQLVAHMNTLGGGRSFFDATLFLQRERWSAAALHKALRRFPWMTAKVIAAIHWEALKLYLKRYLSTRIRHVAGRTTMNTFLTSLAKSAFFKSLESLREGSLELRWNGRAWKFGEPNSPLRAILVVHHDRFFERALFGGDVAIGEAWMDGDWSSPDLVPVVRLAVRNRLWNAFSRGVDALRHRLRGNSIAGSRRNIRAHYDLSNDFFRLFLDRSMMYSCAFFESEGDSLEAAQFQKLDRICRKLRLGPEDHVLEIGTGWGGFAEHAVQNYGCRVTTTGISERQYQHARQRFDSMAGGDRIELLQEDYRSLRGQYGKIVSIEMFEAVGLPYYDEFFGACDRLLRPDGCMLLQTITINEQTFRAYRRRADFIQKHIFPGSELASVSEVLRSLARVTGLSLYHAEDIGTHYARTLAQWRKAVSQLAGRGAGSGLRRPFRSYVGLLSRLLRGSVPGAPYRRFPATVDQEPFAPKAVWRTLGRGGTRD